MTIVAMRKCDRCEKIMHEEGAHISVQIVTNSESFANDDSKSYDFCSITCTRAFLKDL